MLLRPLAQAFMPALTAVPAYLDRDCIAVSPRFPRNGSSAAGPASGITGAAGTIVPQRSVAEAQAWGATVAVWSYTDIAGSYGYASPAAFVGEFTAAGIPIQGTTNASAVDDILGPFAYDAGGSQWKTGAAPNRPALTVGQPSPLASRVPLSISYLPAADQTNTRTPKLAKIATQMAAGCFGLHFDDPRGSASNAGWRGIGPGYDLASQGCEFSTTGIAGFTAWLTANTTSAERIAVGLPSSMAGFDYLAWLKANRASIMFSPNQVDGAAVDNYLFRTSISNDEALRVSYLRWMGSFLRDDHLTYLAQIRAQIGTVPLSHNFYAASPMEYASWHVRRPGHPWTFAISEMPPNYWSDVSAYAVNSSAFFDARMLHVGMRSLTMASHDMAGQLALVENKPTAPNAAPARVLKQMLRQSMVDTAARGGVPVAPYDVFLSTGGSKSQGVDVDGYRFWGAVADYGDIPQFLRANGALLRGYEKMAVVHLAVHGDSFPFHEGSQATRYDALCARIAELEKRDVAYHLLPVGAADGLLPLDPVRAVETAAPIIIRLQDDADYYGHLGRLSASNCRRWSTAAADEAMAYSPVRSLNPYVRATARYNAAAGRVSVHLCNYALNADGTPKPQTTIVRWNADFGAAGVASVVRLGEAPGTVDLSRGYGQVTLREYAILNFAVA